jgi:hypothetical protein
MGGTLHPRPSAPRAPARLCLCPRGPSGRRRRPAPVTVHVFVMLVIYFVSVKYLFVCIKLMCVYVKFLQI